MINRKTPEVPEDSDGKEDFTETGKAPMDDKNDNRIEDDLEKKLDFGLEIPLPEPAKKKFWNTALGRTLRMKNKAGKIIFGTILGAAGSNFLPEPLGGWIGAASNFLISNQTGSYMSFFEGLNLLQIIIVGIAFLITTVVPIIWPKLKKSGIYKELSRNIEPLAEEISAAVDEKSEGGKRITKTELKGIIAEVFARDNK